MRFSIIQTAPKYLKNLENQKLQFLRVPYYLLILCQSNSAHWVGLPRLSNCQKFDFSQKIAFSRSLNCSKNVEDPWKSQIVNSSCSSLPTATMSIKIITSGNSTKAVQLSKVRFYFKKRVFSSHFCLHLKDPRLFKKQYG